MSDSHDEARRRISAVGEYIRQMAEKAERDRIEFRKLVEQKLAIIRGTK